MSAEYLSYPYQGNNVPVRNWGATIGIPIVVFGLGAYWASHYRDRPWYNNQSQWDRPRPHYGRPPYQRPPHAGPRPHHRWPPRSAVLLSLHITQNYQNHG